MKGARSFTCNGTVRFCPVEKARIRRPVSWKDSCLATVLGRDSCIVSLRLRLGVNDTVKLHDVCSRSTRIKNVNQMLIAAEI